MSDNHHSEGCTGSSVAGGPLDGEVAVTPSIEVVFDLLADERRREVCLYLVDLGRAVVTLEEVVQGIAGARSERERERLAIELHHCHLPKLSSAGLIDYDDRSNTLRYWGQPTVEKWARHARAVDDRHAGEP